MEDTLIAQKCILSLHYSLRLEGMLPAQLVQNIVPQGLLAYLHLNALLCMKTTYSITTSAVTSSFTQQPFETLSASVSPLACIDNSKSHHTPYTRKQHSCVPSASPLVQL